jgi:methyltransferase
VNWVALVVGLVGAQRLAELWLAQRNTVRLKAEGAVEHGAAHYPLFVLLHGGWLLALLLTVPADRVPNWLLLGLFVLLQCGRVWAITSLGRRWTTRVVVPAEATLVASGPYRFVRHPNYWIVALEIAVLPLAFGAWQIALVFTALNALLLRHRIRVEERALGLARA